MASTPGKTQVESTAKSTPASAAGPQPALPEKQAGPMRPAPIQRAAAAPPPDVTSTHHTQAAAPPPPDGSLSLVPKHEMAADQGKVQTKLTIGAPNDPYEQEADRTADTVLRMQKPAMPAGNETKARSKPIA